MTNGRRGCSLWCQYVKYRGKGNKGRDGAIVQKE